MKPCSKRIFTIERASCVGQMQVGDPEDNVRRKIESWQKQTYSSHKLITLVYC